jgi:TM2 domain-containing membrane protein YozV
LRKRRSLILAYLLWFFLGIFGIHRFYLGRPISGVIYFLTGGLLGVGWVVDIVLTAFMVEDENHALNYGYPALR